MVVPPGLPHPQIILSGPILVTFDPLSIVAHNDFTYKQTKYTIYPS